MPFNLRLEIFKHKLRNKFLKFFGLPTRKMLAEQHNELMYFQALNEMKRNFNLNLPLYPFGAAANSGLMYLILRCLTTFEFKNIIEFGCGQTTLLIDSMARKEDAKFNITSFEDNKFWLDEVQKQVSHKITHSSLKEKTVNRKIIKFYDFASETKDEKYDFIIVDGPKGTKKYSRYGALEVIPKYLAKDFLIIFDDAERNGEKQTYIDLINQLDKSGIKFHTGSIEGVKHQFIIASDKYQGACYF